MPVLLFIGGWAYGPLEMFCTHGKMMGVCQCGTGGKQCFCVCVCVCHRGGQILRTVITAYVFPVSVAGWLSCRTPAHPRLNVAPDCRSAQPRAAAAALTNGLRDENKDEGQEKGKVNK